MYRCDEGCPSFLADWPFLSGFARKVWFRIIYNLGYGSRTRRPCKAPCKDEGDLFGPRTSGKRCVRSFPCAHTMAEALTHQACFPTFTLVCRYGVALYINFPLYTPCVPSSLPRMGSPVFSTAVGQHASRSAQPHSCYCQL